MTKKLPGQRSTRRDIDKFLGEVRSRVPAQANTSRGRLLFAIDATASRQSTWDTACHLQATMFQSAAKVGSLEMSVCYFRGFGEFRATPWLTNSDTLLRKMTSVTCLAGQTQIARVLKHATKESRQKKIQAVVYVGDACEEASAGLYSLAGGLGMLKTPVFVFQEGQDSRAAQTFEEIARLSGGAYCQLNERSADFLAELLSAVAVFATGGRVALQKLAKERPQLAHITKQIK